MKILVYRVENEFGNGAYSIVAPSTELAKRNNDPNVDRHPAGYCLLAEVSMKNKNEDKYAYYFGFNSLEQFERWFKGCKTVYHKCKFFISVYEVNKSLTYSTEEQIVFKKSAAKKILELPLIGKRYNEYKNSHHSN